MKTIFIDSDFKCHIQNDGTLRAIETDFFDRMCDAKIECFRFVPVGETWTRADGKTFTGMVAPWENRDEADRVQREYERQLLAEYEAALKTVGVSL